VSKSRGCIVQVLFTSFDRRYTKGEWERKFCSLPQTTQARIMKYHRWQDRQAKMLGYLLLKDGLQVWGHGLKSDIFIDHFGRPFLNHEIDFNISHSGGYVVCALTSEGRLGIDIEEIKPIDFKNLKDSMSSVQWEQINESKNMYTSFYDFWTIKESTLKADGRGLSFPLEKVVIHGNQAMLDGRSWYLTKLDISPETSCHLACDIQEKRLEVTEIHYEELVL
jgi:4'-phosphopantetheinyl transferase